MNALPDLRTIAAALGGEVSGRQVLAPGPNHSRRDRSLSVRLSSQSPMGFVTYSHAGDPFDLCNDYVAQRLGLDMDAWRTRGRDRPTSRPASVFTPRDPRADPDHAARVARAGAMWDAAVPAQGTVVERYLAGRGLDLPPGSDALRFLEDCPWRDEAADRAVRVPSMLAAMRQVDGDAVTAVQKTALSAEGVKLDRRMQGIAAGAAIKLDADDAVTHGLHIGEGCETVMQGRQLGFVPGWALGSAGAVAAFPVLGGVECLTILAENDPTNARAVEACAARWHAAGREVIVVEPAAGSDLNDAVRGKS